MVYKRKFLALLGLLINVQLDDTHLNGTDSPLHIQTTSQFEELPS